jgi:signal transduction histidine kinase
VGEERQFELSRADGARALAVGALVIAGVGAADLLFGGDPGPRPIIWAAWSCSYLAASWAALKVPDRAVRAVGVASSLVAVAAMLGLAASGQGIHSPLFLIMPMVPLLTALVSSGDLVNPVLQGLLVTAGGAVIMRQEARPWGEVAVWAVGSLVATAFALGGARRARERQVALVRALAERAEAQAKLAEAERHRGDAERWVTAGHLADQVAHDVNSPLAALRANLRFVREELPGADAEVLRAVADGEEAIEEIRAAVSALKVRTLPPPSRRQGTGG